jgi:hypothetical protein
MDQISIFGEIIEDAKDAMKVSLNIKKPSEFFWLRKIRGVDISQCCAKCFLGVSDTRMFHGTNHGQTPRMIELDLFPSEEFVAYYLCGLAKDFFYANNTHVAFINAPGELLRLETSQIEVSISNAHHIDFQNMGYKPNPEGRYDRKQRTCRNWIFANLIRDGLVEQIRREAGL